MSNDEYEENQLPSSSYFDVIETGTYNAIYSHAYSTELFYVCKVLGKDIADSFLYDDYRHPISKGERYITANYLDEKRKCVL